jgi:hypothetical protein
MIGIKMECTMSDQEFETFREFENLDFLFSLATPVLQILPNHFWVLFKYNCQVFGKGELHEQVQEFI